MVDLLEGRAHSHAYHGWRSMDVLLAGHRRVPWLRTGIAGPLGAQVRHRRGVLHAPQVRPQAVPGAVYRPALHRRVHADRADVPLRASVGQARTLAVMPVLAMLHPFTQ